MHNAWLPPSTTIPPTGEGLPGSSAAVGAASAVAKLSIVTQMVNLAPNSHLGSPALLMGWCLRRTPPVAGARPDGLGLTPLFSALRGRGGCGLSPDLTQALAPDVLSFRGGRVQVQVADVGLLGVGLETTSDPQGLGTREEGVPDEDESYQDTVYSADL